MTTLEIQEQLFRKIPQLSPEQQEAIYKMVESFSHKTEKKAKRQAGTLKGSLKYMASDFDEPLDEFKDYMPE
ncbi:MAG: DUF2281 domain-containing protein [Microscillaceae bacterium]|nr:DUF2281 domain-containing protein [Microscillaceae bacterium]